MFMICIMQAKVSLAQIMNCKYFISIKVLIYIDITPILCKIYAESLHDLKALTFCNVDCVLYHLRLYHLPSNENSFIH